MYHPYWSIQMSTICLQANGYEERMSEVSRSRSRALSWQLSKLALVPRPVLLAHLYEISLLSGALRNIEDQHRNTNMINKDHLVGQLTTVLPALFYLACACFSLHSPTANWMPLAITCLSKIHNPDHQALLIYLSDISLLFLLNQKCFSTQNNYDFVPAH